MDVTIYTYPTNKTASDVRLPPKPPGGEGFIVCSEETGESGVSLYEWIDNSWVHITTLEDAKQLLAIVIKWTKRDAVTWIHWDK